MMGFDPGLRLDPFQERAIEAVEAGRSVVVAAPTGSGKTLVAEAAMHMVRRRGGKVFYTTPIKALSNQKFGDFRKVFGDESVGLLTGDNTINGEAPIVVMTTEVLRNMIYARSQTLERLEVVVLDEVHYLQDRFRGAVWEEVIIHAPAHVQLVCLSATVANADQFSGWIRTRRGPTDLIVEEHRPVPLESLYAVKDRWNEKVRIEPLLLDGKPNRSLEGRLAGRNARRYGPPRRIETVVELDDRGLLPAIYFIFSRAGCEDAARKLVSAGARFTDETERERIRSTAERHTASIERIDLGALGYEEWLYGLEMGVAPHHAGMIPAFKQTVEELFVRGLIRVVFATETLALGINMPARTVVIESLSRFNGEAHEILRPGDFTQLTGRAGRRGIDDIGYGVVLHSRFIPFRRVTELASAGSHPLRSSFRPTYNMAVNLVANYDVEQAERLLDASFAQYQRRKGQARLAKEIRRLEKRLGELEKGEQCERGDVREYVNLLRSGEQHGPAKRFLSERRVGDVIEIPAGRRAGRYVVAQRSPKRQEVSAVSEQGELMRIRPSDLHGAVFLGRFAMPKPFKPGSERFRRRVAAGLKRFTPGEVIPLRWESGELPSHPVASCPDRRMHLESVERADRARRDLERLRDEMNAGYRGLVGEFHAIIDLLRGRGYLHDWGLTAAGERLRSIYNELDLLLAEALGDGVLESLTPSELAAVVSMVVYEPRREETGSVLWPTAAIESSVERLERLWSEIVEDEQRHRLPPSRRPDAGFVERAFRWSEGETLEMVLEGGEAGDFVRVCRQLLDVLRQIRDAAPWLRPLVSDTIGSIDRGVVAAEGIG